MKVLSKISKKGAVTPSLIIGAVVIVIIGTAMLPVVVSMCAITNFWPAAVNCTQAGGCNNPNMCTLISLIPLLYVVVLIVGVVAYVVVASEAI